MRNKADAAREVAKKFSSYIPAFQDVFDEESFYIFVFVIIIGSVVAAVLASRYVKVNDAGHLD